MAEMLIATSRLRYVRKLITMGDQDQYAGFVFMLQQQWRNNKTGEESWQDLPVVDEETGEELPSSSLFFGQTV